MTLKHHYYKTDETFQELAFKLKMETRQVKFGPFNAIPKNFDRFPKPWVGEINERGEYFKLFRTKGQEYTSDLSVHGKYVVLSGQEMIHIEHKLHYMSLVGFSGLAIAIVAVFFLLSKKDIIVHPILQILAGMIAFSVYGYTFYRDLLADEKLIRQLLYAKLEQTEEGDEEDEREYE
jgi:hypothetical protein